MHSKKIYFMACALNRDYCTRSSGCSNCPHNINGGRRYLDIDWEKECERADREEQDRIKLKQQFFINDKLPQCVVPLLNVDGVGFFIENHFVTCGHCLEQGGGVVKIFFEGKMMAFHTEDAVINRVIHSQLDEKIIGDVAIFPMSGVKNYFKIGVDPYMYLMGSFYEQSLTIASIAHKCDNISNTVMSPFFTSPEEKYQLTTSNAEDMSLLAIDKNDPSGFCLNDSFESSFFEVHTENALGPGTSGSPIFNEYNEVLGLLVGCRNPNTAPNVILFDSLNKYGCHLGLCDLLD